MNFDLFAFLENVVQGLVSFVYSLALSLWAIVRHPVTGPLRLHGRYLRKNRRQLGGITFLYLGVFLSLFFIFRSGDLTASEVLGAAGDGIIDAPSMDAGGLWPLIAGALAGTIVIDAAIRLWLHGRWGRQKRRDWFLAAAEYALFLAVIPSAFLGWYLGIYNCPANVSVLPPLAWAAAGAIGVLCVPAAVLLGLPLSPDKRAEAGRAAGAGGVALRTGVLWALVALAGFVSVQAALAISGEGEVCFVP